MPESIQNSDVCNDKGRKSPGILMQGNHSTLCAHVLAGHTAVEMNRQVSET